MNSNIFDSYSGNMSIFFSSLSVEILTEILTFSVSLFSKVLKNEYTSSHSEEVYSSLFQR